MKKDYAKTADTLIAALGGKENITRLFHSMTYLIYTSPIPRDRQKSRKPSSTLKKKMQSE